jgi:hypothetical protein
MAKDILDVFSFLTEEQKEKMRKKKRFSFVAEKLKNTLTGKKYKDIWDKRFTSSPEKDHAVEKEGRGNV